MPSPLPLTRDVVFVGGGHTHALVMRMWGMKPLQGARLTLITPEPTAAYSGMLPGHVAGHYARGDLDLDLVRLARFAGARLILGAARGIDREARMIDVTGRPPVAYDIASIDVGITSDMPDLPGFSEHAVPAKPLGIFAALWAGFAAAVAAGTARPEVVVIGAGVAGVELALAMAHRLRSLGPATGAPSVTLIEARDALSALRPPARARLRAILSRHGVALREHASVTDLTEGHVHLADGTQVAFGFCVGTAGTRPHDWLHATGLSGDSGFIDVGADLVSTRDPALYAVGDCAHLTHAPRPKAGVFAVREAPILFHNLRADLTGGTRRAYHPQRDYLKLISLGEKSALVEKGPMTLAAPWLWRLKNRIDQAFMDKFRHLPRMPAQGLPVPAVLGLRAEMDSGKPLCGGCGAKVGAADLRDALCQLPASRRGDILSAPGDDAAILAVGGATLVLTTDHLRAVVEDPYLMTQIAATHALGDIWAMGADPQAALSTVILPRMSPALQRRTLTEITHAANSIFRAAGAEVVGGHTTLGSELTLGFTVTGLATTPPLTLSGARPGDALILARPIGSGTLLAAEMEGIAQGAWMAALYAEMIRSQGPAAALLGPVAHAMTDVTGFGLAGHLLAMAEASGVGAQVDRAALIFHDGAEELALRGVRSSLYAANLADVAPRLVGFGESVSDPLILDPQTCGGLLAAVPEEAAAEVLDALGRLGSRSARIGCVTAAPPRLELA